ncbi:MAG: GNAT family protein [Candidatus Bathyarchaeia archaeon]
MKTEIINAKQTKLKVKDVKAIAEIECHEKVREWLIIRVETNVEREYLAYRRFFRNLPKNRRAEILVAKNGERVAGFLGLWRYGTYMDHVAAIGISVHPDFWGKGIATRLMKAALKLAKEIGIIRLEIETRADNYAMRHVAEKAGFKLEKIRRKRIRKNGNFYDEASYYMLLDNPVSTKQKKTKKENH